MRLFTNIIAIALIINGAIRLVDEYIKFVGAEDYSLRYITWSALYVCAGILMIYWMFVCQ